MVLISIKKNLKLLKNSVPMFVINQLNKKVQKHGFFNNKNGEFTLLMIVQEMLMLWDKLYKLLIEDMDNLV